MKIRAGLMTLTTFVVTFGVAACAAKPNKVMADHPVLPYQAPDISEITGIEEPDDEEPEAEEGTATPAPPATK